MSQNFGALLQILQAYAKSIVTKVIGVLLLERTVQEWDLVQSLLSNTLSQAEYSWGSI